MIGCDSGFVTGYLDDRVARKLFPRLDMVTAGNFFPTGRADRIDGGYKVNGQWAFGSGITHADFAMSTCVIFENGAPVMKDSMPVSRRMVAPASAYEIIDNWHTTGMRGTGSVDFRATDLFIPEEHSYSVFEPPKRDGVLWRRPTTFIPKASGVPLGAARVMLDTVTEIMQTKVEMPGGRPYKNLPRIQSVIADAEMILGAARSYVFSATEREWKKLEKNEPLTEKERAHAWLSRINIFQSARDVIRMLYDAVERRTRSILRFATPKLGASISRFNAERSNGSAGCCSNRTVRRRLLYCKGISERDLKRIVDAGVRTPTGTDTFCGFGKFGEIAHTKIEHYERAGIPLLRILKMAASEAAQHLGADDLGTIASGKLADMILVDGDPVTNITALRDISTVIKNGEIVSAQG